MHRPTTSRPHEKGFDNMANASLPKTDPINRFNPHGFGGTAQQPDIPSTTIVNTDKLRSPNELVEMIKNKPDYVTSVLLESDKFKLNIPIGEKDVMSMKVIQFIIDEYGDHTMDEAIEMLQDTIWWHTTFLVLFPDSGSTKRKHEDTLK